MWDQSQLRYMQDVLGLSYLPTQAAEPISAEPTELPQLLVLTQRLSSEESALLQKILASVRLPPPQLLEVETFAGHSAEHVVCFDGGSGSQVGADGCKTWHLPELRGMLGNASDVTALKRTTWTLLQQLSQEIK